MDIEKVAHDTPEKIVTITVDPVANICPHHVRRLAKALGLDGDLAKQMSPLITNLYKAFVETDMSLLEINPLVITKDKKLLCLDAKVGFDDNALFRHPDIAALRDETEEDEKEIEASKYDLNYIALDGEIGCMVNGAGLAMATMDIIKLYGVAPANFLDVGGGATTEKVTAAFKIITSDPNVKGILVNIFGGIMKCDIIAEGVVDGREGSRPAGAAGGAARRHQCREGQGDHREVESQRDLGRRSRRRRAEDREGREGRAMIASNRVRLASSARSFHRCVTAVGAARIRRLAISWLVASPECQLPPSQRLRSASFDLNEHCGLVAHGQRDARLVPTLRIESRSTHHVHPHRQEHQGHLPGLHRQERHLPFAGRDRLRHQDGRRHRAGQRRHDPSRPAGVRHRRGGEGEDRLRRERDLRAAARRRRRDRGGDRRRDPADRLHHRRHSGRRHGEGEALARRLEVAPGRPELSRA